MSAENGLRDPGVNLDFALNVVLTEPQYTTVWPLFLHRPSAVDVRLRHLGVDRLSPGVEFCA